MRDTEAMLASASPRKPRVRTRYRSSTEDSLLVACRAKAVSTWSAGMPLPLSATLIDAPAALADLDAHVIRTGVDGVLDEFLDD